MELTRVNLNLLVALDALLTERQVTRAGQKLHITQAAMSNILNQLREIFQDELLIRHAKGMLPTQRALILQPQVRQILEQIESVVYSQQVFEPANSERCFSVAIPDQCASVLLPVLGERLRLLAPRVRLRLKTYAHVDDVAIFESGHIDLGIGLLFDRSPQLKSQLLFNERAVCAAHKDHPLMQGELSLEEYLAADHVAIKCQTDPSLSYTDTALQALGKERKRVFTVTDIFPALTLLERMPLIGTLPQHAANALAAKFNLIVRPLPFHVPEIPFMQIWHKQKDNDPGLRWLREIIQSCVDSIDTMRVNPTHSKG